MRTTKYFLRVFLLSALFVLLASGTGTVSAQGLAKKCGDGICDEAEQMDPNLCPQDCEKFFSGARGRSNDKWLMKVDGQPSDKFTQSMFKPMPAKFVIAGEPFATTMGEPPETMDKNINRAVKLGMKWVRLTGPSGIVWDQIERSPGHYDWRRSDEVILKAHRAGLKILVTVLVVNDAYRVPYGAAPSNMKAFETFIRKAAERYNGNGVDDAPGSPVVSAWQIANEVDGNLSWRDSMEKYAELLKVSSRAIRSVSNSKIAIAGMLGSDGINKYKEILNYLRGDRAFDIFDLHWHAVGGGNYIHQRGRGRVENFDNYVESVRTMLNNTGYENVEIWITEMSSSHKMPYGRTEEAQAIELIKRYFYPVSRGVSMVFWAGIQDQCWKDNCNHYFANIGLVKTNSRKTLAYYSYKLMADTLQGANWNSFEVVRAADHVYIYKIMTHNYQKPVWVIWWDFYEEGGESKTINLACGDVKEITIMDAVASVASGADIDENNYLKYFNQMVYQPKNKEVTIKLQKRPVFLIGR